MSYTQEAGFNRTFMELKYRNTVQNLTISNSFNRTFMELKLLKIIISPILLIVLIVPLWN